MPLANRITWSAEGLPHRILANAQGRSSVILVVMTNALLRTSADAEEAAKSCMYGAHPPDSWLPHPCIHTLLYCAGVTSSPIRQQENLLG